MSSSNDLESKSTYEKIVISVALALSASIMAYSLFAPQTMPTVRALREELQVQKNLHQEKAKYVEKLQHEVSLLSGETPESKAYLDARIRSELGYVRSDEVVILVDQIR